MSKDYRALRHEVQSRSVTLLFEDFDFGEDDEIYAHLLEEEE